MIYFRPINIAIPADKVSSVCIQVQFLQTKNDFWSKKQGKNIMKTFKDEP